MRDFEFLANFFSARRHGIAASWVQSYGCRADQRTLRSRRHGALQYARRK